MKKDKDVVNELGESSLPLPGSLINVLIGSFCEKPVNGDSSSPYCSIGVAENSVVATNRRFAIIVGLDVDGHVATVREEAMIEAYRGGRYGEPVKLDEIERLVDTATGEVKTLEGPKKVIDKMFPRLYELATVSPEAMIAIGKVAQAAGAREVKLLQAPADAGVLGFSFEFAPEDDFQDLFSSWEGMITAKGVFAVKGAKTEGEGE